MLMAAAGQAMKQNNPGAVVGAIRQLNQMTGTKCNFYRSHGVRPGNAPPQIQNNRLQKAGEQPGANWLHETSSAVPSTAYGQVSEDLTSHARGAGLLQAGRH